jgi:ribonucleoside-diphosphate reductase beta chain
VFVRGFGHFAGIAGRLQWDERDVALQQDRAAWPEVELGSRQDLQTLLTGFCVGEASVADQLAPFAQAALDPEAAACFELQAVDEARHARFFDRCAREVMAISGSSLAVRRARLKQEVTPEFLELFERRLPEVVRSLSDRADTLEAAVALYHLVLEGVVFTAGQLAMLELLEDQPLPGLRRGLELVLRDERWHIGFGTSLLAAGGGVPHTDAIDAAEHALDAWGDAVPDGVRARVLSLHRRRLRAGGLVPQPASLSRSRPPRTPRATPTS